jgi:hypothetical protein
MEQEYTLRPGDIMGMEYNFAGSGEVDNYQFSDDRAKIWKEGFLE